MTPRQADKVIKAGLPVTVRDNYGDTFTARFTRRDRWNIWTDGAEVPPLAPNQSHLGDPRQYDRTDLTLD